MSTVKIIEVEGGQFLKWLGRQDAPLRQLAGADDGDTVKGRNDESLVPAFIEINEHGKVRCVLDGANPAPEKVIEGQVRRYAIPPQISGRRLVETMQALEKPLGRVQRGLHRDRDGAVTLSEDARQAEALIRRMAQRLWEDEIARREEVTYRQPKRDTAERLFGGGAPEMTGDEAQAERERLRQQDGTIGVTEVNLKRVWREDSNCVEYCADDGAVWFRDHGSRVEVVHNEDEAVMEAMRVAADKFGGAITISGPPEFREKAVKMAVKLGIGVLDEDLAEMVAAEKARLGVVEADLGSEIEDEDQEQECSFGMGM